MFSSMINDAIVEPNSVAQGHIIVLQFYRVTKGQTISLSLL